MENKKWIIICSIGGVLMIIGSATGSAGFYTFIYNQFSSYISNEWKPLIVGILTVLKYIAIYGGYSVLVGVVLTMLKQYWLGRFIISIATGFGLLGIIIYIVVLIIGYTGISVDPGLQLILDELYNLFSYNSGFAFAGTILAIIGRIGLKKPKIVEEIPVSEVEEEEPSMLDNLKNKYCPNCGTILPIHANFCRECGKSFD